MLQQLNATQACHRIDQALFFQNASMSSVSDDVAHVMRSNISFLSDSQELFHKDKDVELAVKSFSLSKA